MAKKKKKDGLEEDYEYHKQNDYPGERIAERERVEARRKEKHIVYGIGIVLIVLLLAGSIWSFTAIEKQSDEIDSLKLSLANAGVIQYDDVKLSDEAKQIQLYKDFVVLTNDVEAEVSALEDYDTIYSDMYQLCSGFAERENNINHALYRFAEKKIVYYRQIADLADKPECNSRIENMRSAMETSKVADEKLYVKSKELCNEVTDDEISEEAKSDTGWNAARKNAERKANAFEDAEQSVIECLN